MKLNNKIFTIKICGESGQGINSVGELLNNAFKDVGYFSFAYREYPSLIKGGVASYQIDISGTAINSSKHKVELLLAVSRVSLHENLTYLNDGAILIHTITALKLSSEEQELIERLNVKLHYVNAEELLILNGSSPKSINIFMSGIVWKILGLHQDSLQSEVLKFYNDKPQFTESNLTALRLGYELEEIKSITVETPPKSKNIDALSRAYNIPGNHALAIGAHAAGMRAFYAYPMTPASSILDSLAEISSKTGALVKQVEDEITAAQMTLGSMYAGTRALTATSGGGFDLMSESLSLAGITETPFVVVLAQRPGPATGLPTWTSAGDFQLALNAGHGEFPRVILSCYDAASAYTLIQEAFNIAEKYQVVVVLLTEKQIAESVFNLEKIPETLQIERGLEQPELDQEPTSTERYMFTPNGVSKRWLPGSYPATYLANSDEHSVDGSLTEDAVVSKSMMEKRMQKLETIAKVVPEPELHGAADNENFIITYGSSYNTLLDTLKVFEIDNVSIINYQYLYPLNTKLLELLIQNGRKLWIMEQNFTGQFEKEIRSNIGNHIKSHFRKYDGRPFFIEEVYNFIMKEVLR